MKLHILAAAAAISALSVSPMAHAATITYTLSNVNLTLGVGGPADGTLSGTFTVNTATDALTAANIVASPGTVAPFNGGGFDFIFGGGSANATEVASGTTFFELWNSGGVDELELNFATALNGSGTDAITSAAFEDESGTIGLRNVGGGSAIIGSPVAAPEPSSLALLGTGMAAAAGLLRRRRAQFLA